ncbi:Phage protein [Yersinia phage fHe-Yen9-03]|uniref:Phage protein n=1 Tax=Yersinia phage fHe-Yen9-03 TaxID=2052743 RepID=A0A2C9D0M6_9CAUD|nr:Phage protein [Yersinia phage fHe-Yen9-03]
MYNQSGDIITIAREFGNKIGKIPSGTYTVEQNPQTSEFYLLKSSPFIRPSKVYGEMSTRNEKVIKTFLSRTDKNTGVLLSGTKGAGKTQLAKDVSIALAEIGIPTIIVQNCYVCGGFINFIKAIEDQALILFDEFEKVYNKSEYQEAILTLLDGTGSYNKLYILTSNNRNVSEFLRNRPSRIFYHFEYRKLSKQVMFDLLNDKLVNKNYIPQFDTLWEVAETISFDMIQCLIEELNRYPTQTFTETFRELNVEVDARDGNAFLLSEFTLDGKHVKFDEEFYNHFTTFSFMAKYDDFRVYLLAEEGTLQKELLAISARVYGDEPYKEDDDEGALYTNDDENTDEVKIREIQYFINLEFNKLDTQVRSTDIVIDRELNGVQLHAKFVKAESPDVIETMFDGK